MPCGPPYKIGFCFPHESQMFCEEPYRVHLEPTACSNPGLERQKTADECSQYKTRVIKTIRFNNLEFTAPLLADEKLHVKVISVIRDPRAIMSSRLKILKTTKSHFNMLRHEIDPVEYFLNMLEEDCDLMIKNFEFMLKNHRIKHRIMFTRYEDIALNNHGVVEQLHEWIGVEFPDNVRDWMMQTTHNGSKLHIGGHTVDWEIETDAMVSLNEQICNFEIPYVRMNAKIKFDEVSTSLIG